MAKIYIDNKEYIVDTSKNLLEAMLSVGFDLPYFCWHPAMGSVGACRQCAVIKFKDENDKKGRIIMSCMEPVTENLRISFSSPEAVSFRKAIIEWLMINHPHDCPVCDEGGECHLQDMTVMTGHNYRRYNFQKRTYVNQNLGPFINHEMNRCIQCYRCVRFYRNYAGGRDLDVFAAHDHIYFGRHKDGVLENEFSGNLVEVCPTGVFTDKTLKQHYTRKWDLTSAPSICPHCSLGCNTLAGERYGVLRRILTRYNGQVNGYFLCDRGRFGYEFVNDSKRIKNASYSDKKKNQKMLLSKDEALRKIKELDSGNIVGIGSPRASLESNFALKKLVSPENFFAGENRTNFRLIKKIYNNLKNSPVKTPGLREIEKCDAVFILGEDITNTAPMMSLAVRQAAKQKPVKDAEKAKIPEWNDDAVRTFVQESHGPVFIATPYSTKLADIASENIIMPADKLASFGFSLANALDKNSPAVIVNKDDSILIKSIADELKKAENPVIISGTGCFDEQIIDAAFNIANALYLSNKNVKISLAVPECNSMGLAMMTDKDLDDFIFEKTEKETVIILENDLYRRKGEKDLDSVLQKFKTIIVLDHIENKTSDKADILIPAGTYAESDGTYVNNEGRAQRFYQVYPPKGDILESWRWLGMLNVENNEKLSVFDDFVKELIETHPQFGGIENLAPPASYRKAGLKIPRQPGSYSGRTAIKANINVHEEQPPADSDSPLAFSMEGYRGKPPSSVIPYFWSPGWNSAQAINKYQIETGGPLHDGDPGLRLMEPATEQINYLKGDFPKNTSQLNIIPFYHIFGSDELSAFSPSVSSLSPEKPYVFLNHDYAKELRLKDGEYIEISTTGNKYNLQIKITEGIPMGTMAISHGIRGYFIDYNNCEIKTNYIR